MISDHYDASSARLMLAYLGHSLKKHQDREIARKKIRLEIQKLKNISTASMRKYLKRLEHSVGDAIKKEQHILKKQHDEDLEHSDINQKIREIEERLERYLQVHEERAQKVRLLESIYTTEQKTARQQLIMARKALSRAQKIYASAKKSKKNKEQLALIKEQMSSLHAKIKQLEKKYY